MHSECVGVTGTFQYKKIARELGPPKAMPLPAFHVLTDYDKTSALFGKDRKTALSMWQSLLELTSSLQLLSRDVRTRTTVLERFTTQLYGVYEDEITAVYDARLYLFLHKRRKNFENMSQNIDALHQKILSDAYHSGHIWGNILNTSPDPLSPINCR